jgi:hypothetical protein
MHTFLYLLFFSLAGLNAQAQSPYFLYIQSEDRQPFYVRLNDKIFSSSSTGYLIISKLEEGNYPILLGFPRNIYPEQQFLVRINKKDKGFHLSRTSDKGWQLVNLQNQEVIASAAGPAKNPELSGERKTDAFSVMLANVVNDSTILYAQTKPQPPQAVAQQKPVQPKKEEVRQTPPVVTKTEDKDIQAEALIRKEAMDTLVATNANQPDTGYVTVKIKETTSTLPDNISRVADDKRTPDDKPFITRISEEKSTTAYKAIYLEQYNYSTDTIDITIPVEGITTAAVKKDEPVKESLPIVKEEDRKGVTTDSSSVVLQIGNVTDTFAVKKRIVMINSDCKNFATDNDVDKLRVRLIAAKSIDDKLNVARRYYRTKCFNVQQVRALTELFPTDETKYRFLDLSYAFTSDSGNYYLLEEVINEDYYKNRFKAMIRK